MVSDNGKGLASQQTPEELGKRPTSGERTKAQAGVGGLLMLGPSDPRGMAGIFEPPPATFITFRKIRANPTVTMARVASLAPIKRAPVAVIGTDDAKDEWVDFIRDNLLPAWPMLCRESLRAIEYGFQSFEKVFDQLPDGSLIIRKFKPLLPDKTRVIMDKQNGQFLGVKNQSIDVPASNVFLYPHDMEAGNFYGRSRYENVRKSWWRWDQTADRLGMYGKKVSGATPIIHYPEGEANDKTGNKEETWKLALAVLDNLSENMRGVAVPNTIASYAEDMLKAGVDIGQLRQWQISFLETKGQHGADFVTQLGYWDKQMARGMLVPERAILEGVHGTKAEAGKHADIALLVAEETLLDLIRCVNWWVVNQLLVLNFGPEAENQVRLEPGPISDADREFFRDLITKIITNPTGLELLFDVLDMNAIIDKSNLPRVEPGQGLSLPELTPLLKRVRSQS